MTLGLLSTFHVMGTWRVWVGAVFKMGIYPANPQQFAGGVSSKLWDLIRTNVEKLYFFSINSHYIYILYYIFNGNLMGCWMPSVLWKIKCTVSNVMIRKVHFSAHPESWVPKSWNLTGVDDSEMFDIVSYADLAHRVQLEDCTLWQAASFRAWGTTLHSWGFEGRAPWKPQVAAGPFHETTSIGDLRRPRQLCTQLALNALRSLQQVSGGWGTVLFNFETVAKKNTNHYWPLCNFSNDHRDCMIHGYSWGFKQLFWGFNQNFSRV